MLLTLAACAKTPAAELTTEPADEAPDWQTKYDLGVRYLSEGKYEEAILAFTAAIEIDPKRAEAFLGRGDTYEKLVDLERAAADYRVALELEPNADAEIKLKKWEAELLSAQLQDELWPMVRDLVLPTTVDSVVLGETSIETAKSIYASYPYAKSQPDERCYTRHGVQLLWYGYANSCRLRRE
ncbi:MAG: tetratricopeptide repeat protein [Acutalibacteraceae bacterium]